MIASEDDSSDAGLLHAVQVSVATLSVPVPVGDYAFAAELWMFAGAREEETVRAIFCQLTGGAPIANDAAFDLLNALRAHGCDWIDARQAMPRPEGAIDVLDEARA